MDEAAILRRIRAKLDFGTLPRQPPLRTWGSLTGGGGDLCAVCDERISPGDAEIQADSADGQHSFYHPVCYNLLAAERRRLAE